MFDSSASSRRNVKLNVNHDLNLKSFGSNAILDNKPIITENKTYDATCNGGKQQTYDDIICGGKQQTYERLNRGSKQQTYDGLNCGGKQQTYEELNRGSKQQTNETFNCGGNNEAYASNHTYDIINSGGDTNKNDSLKGNRKQSLNNTHSSLQNAKDINLVRGKTATTTAKRKYILFGLVGFIVGNVIAGITVYVIMKYCVFNCSDNSLQNSTLKECNGLMFSLEFDPYTINPILYLSNDNRILGNRQTDITPKRIIGEPNQLRKYDGLIGNTCVKDNTKVYYEVKFEYKIYTALRSTRLILEIGLAQRDQIDVNDFLGYVEKGWSFALARCGTSNNVCIRARHEGKLKTNKFYGKNKPGLTVSDRFGILIDRERNTFSLTSNKTVIYTYQNVESYFDLCPVFGVYNKNLLDVRLQIINSTAIT